MTHVRAITRQEVNTLVNLVADDLVTQSLKQTSGPKALPGAVFMKQRVLFNYDFACHNSIHLRRSFGVKDVGFLDLDIDNRR